MSDNKESIGIMDPAFFVGKNILIKWVNELLNVNVGKVEEMATGAYYCQLLDMIYRDPPLVSLSKVNFGAKFDYEYVKNWNVLQAVFTAQGIQKYVDVAKLVKAKYQDNLEFFQWFKSWFDSKYGGGGDYDPKAKREASIKAKGGKLPSAPSVAASKPAAPSKVAKAPAVAAIPKPSKPAPAASSIAKKAVSPAKVAPKKTGGDSQEVEELTAKMAKLRTTIEGLEKERNFYFGKLRTIEVLCQQDEGKDVETKGKVLQVLYSTEDPEEKAPADSEAHEEGEAGAQEDQPAESLLDTGVAEGDLLAAEEPAAF
jgi:RP/EB family microtubule-associated protein